MVVGRFLAPGLRNLCVRAVVGAARVSSFLVFDFEVYLGTFRSVVVVVLPTGRLFKRLFVVVGSGDELSSSETSSLSGTLIYKRNYYLIKVFL